MYQHGARKFLFFQRSGLSNSSAKKFVESLRERNADASVYQGDVCNAEAVADAINSIQGPIGGVVQGAMGLSVSSGAFLRRRRITTNHTHRSHYSQT